MRSCSPRPSLRGRGIQLFSGQGLGVEESGKIVQEEAGCLCVLDVGSGRPDGGEEEEEDARRCQPWPRWRKEQTPR